METEKNPGPDWEVDFRCIDDEDVSGIETMSLFGMATEAKALEQAHASLSWAGIVYEIIAVRRIG